MDVVVVVVVLFVVVLVISAPLRRARQTDAAWTGELAELEAAREAKYREIRDAELDHRTGKLSDADYEALDSVLRAEAVVILRQLDDVKERAATAPAPASGR
ncbi:MAG TPA: hypothetical protein VMD09_08880 [Solirubrobacteraceae bacterium]|nr:hypothetical protein [Solirubrobacteraceae bacterium]